MKINFAQPFLNLEGEPIKDDKGEQTLYSKQIGNLIFQSPDKENALSSYELAKKVYYCDDQTDFSKSEVEKIKEKIKEGFIAGFVGQVLELISASELADKSKAKE